MLEQNAAHFINRNRMLLHTVSGLDHQFAADRIQMGTGIFNYAVGTAGRGLFIVADD